MGWNAQASASCAGRTSRHVVIVATSGGGVRGFTGRLRSTASRGDAKRDHLTVQCAALQDRIRLAEQNGLKRTQFSATEAQPHATAKITRTL